MQVSKRTWNTVFFLSSISFLCASSLFAQYQDQSGQYDPNDPPAAIARIGYLQGDVSLQAAGTDDWSQAPPNYPMVGGDRIYTGARARAVVQLGGAELRLWQATDVSLTNITDQYEQIGLAAGSLRLHVFQMDPGSQIEVDTPNGATIIESPGDYRFEAFAQSYQQGASSIVTINSGNAQITGPGINQPVSGGYSIGLFGTNPVELQYLDVPDYDDLDYWSFNLDRGYQNSISARYVSRQMVGYGDLDANGTWNPDTQYGPGWFPNNVPQGWQPYSAGHWAYVAPWGYTWVDDAPWGFAPFHYGRWSQIDGRWGWFPGPPAVRPVYSPALVAFVGGGPGGGGGGISIGIHFGSGGVGVSAWFPIGVGEPYVPWYRCSPRYAERVNSTNVNIAVIRNTTVVNNYNTYIHKTVINNTRINNTTVNNTVVNNFNYANRAQVTAVPASAMASGASVSRQAVQLSPQQRQQIAQAPISVRPTAPAPATPHPSLIAAANVTRPAARPALMTPNGIARAVPSATPARPVVIAKLPTPTVVPKNAPPPAAAPKPIQPNRPSAPVPVAAPVRPVVQPARPAVPQPAPVTRPGAPVSAPVSSAPVTSAPVARPAPLARPNPPAQPTPQPKPAPAPIARPTPPVRPVTPLPAPAVKPAPAPATAPVVRQPPQPRPGTVTPPPQVKPVPKPNKKPDPKDDKKPDPKDEK